MADAADAPARPSISRSSACCSTPVRGRTGAIAIRATGQRSAVRGAGAREPAHVRGRRIFRRPARPAARRCRARWRTCADRASRADFRSATAIRWSGSKAAPPCCAASARRAGPARRSLASDDAARPGGLFDHLAARPPGRHARRRRRSSRCCSRISARSGRAAEARRRAAGRLLAASRDRDAAMRPTASCRCTSSRSGSPIR